MTPADTTPDPIAPIAPTSVGGAPVTAPSAAPWWHTSTVYQVYPRSFQDSDGDGIGDIPGITSRVPYLQRLGVDVVWLSPVYRSPMEDNGYDISDYDDVDPLFGTLADLDDLIAALHERGMRLVMDLVVNHTSSRHDWFQQSRDPHSPLHDWYIWRDGRSGGPTHPDAAPGEWRGDEPNHWAGAFSGPVWTWDEEAGQYYLHLFTPGQPDLNWDNPQVRAEVFAMMRRWLDRGVDGFRMDVINLISKDPSDFFADDTDGGLHRVMFGPHFHDYIQEMRREVFDAYPDRVFLTVGETPGATVEQARLTTDPARRELDMVFQFEHMGLDSTDGQKYHHRALHLPDMKANLARWSLALAGHGWNSLYLSNHDQPRPVSRYGDAEHHRHASATAWAAMLHAHPGTPYVFEGEELGMANFPWSSTDQMDDVEALGYWRDRVVLGGSAPSEVWPSLCAMTRDNARTPMQWDATGTAGFTTGTPWLPVNPDHERVNAADQVGRGGSTFEFFRRMISLRRTLPVLVDGDFRLLEPDDTTLWWVVRSTPDGRVLDAVGNMSSEPIACAIPDGHVVLSNREAPASGVWERAVLAPWEVRWVLHRQGARE